MRRAGSGVLISACDMDMVSHRKLWTLDDVPCHGRLLHMWIWRALAGPEGPADDLVVSRLTRVCIGYRIALIVVLFERYVFWERIHACKDVIKRKKFEGFRDFQ